MRAALPPTSCDSIPRRISSREVCRARQERTVVKRAAKVCNAAHTVAEPLRPRTETVCKTFGQRFYCHSSQGQTHRKVGTQSLRSNTRLDAREIAGLPALM